MDKTIYLSEQQFRKDLLETYQLLTKEKLINALIQRAVEMSNKHSENTPFIKSVCDEKAVVKGIEDLMTEYQIYKEKKK